MIDRMIAASLLLRVLIRFRKAQVPVLCLSISKLMLSQHRLPRCSRLGSDLLITQRRPVNFQLQARTILNSLFNSCHPCSHTTKLPDNR